MANAVSGGGGPKRACSKCGAPLVAGNKFCAGCGSPLDRSCSECGVPLLATDSFCPECGTPAQPSSPSAAPSAGYSSFWDVIRRRLRAHLAAEYRITRELGRGGQAAVFLAEQLKLNRQVAIKVLTPGSISGEGAIDRFRREAKLVASLKHAHIVTVHDVLQFEELHLFVMQYLEGRSLAAVIADQGQLSVAAVRSIAYQVGDALQYAHRRKVIHRDVKPANVLFDEEGNAVVTDFGIAKDVSAQASTETGPLMGTPAYLSPERCWGLPATWESDQYALGILIYEMLAGRVPFAGNSFEMMQAHTLQEPPPLRSLRPDCPVDVERAVMRMLAKGPQDRWASMSDALAALGARPLSGDDPVREELRQLALGGPNFRGSAVTPTMPPRRTPSAVTHVRQEPEKIQVRLTLRLPERLEVGETATCAIFAYYGTQSQPQPQGARWRVEDSESATIDEQTGGFVGRTPGQIKVIAETPHGTAEGRIEIVPAAAHEVVLSLSKPTLEVGESVRANADVFDRRGTRLERETVWESLTPTVAAVASDGAVLGVSPGSAKLVASSDGVKAERTVFVQDAEVTAIALSDPPQSIGPRASFVITAEVYDRRGARLERAVRWESSKRTVAAVDRDGVVETKAAGKATITARIGGVASATVVIVSAPPKPAPPLPVELVDSSSGNTVPPVTAAAVFASPPLAEDVGDARAPSMPVADMAHGALVVVPEGPAHSRSASARRPLWLLVGLPLLLMGVVVWRVAATSTIGPTEPDTTITLDTAITYTAPPVVAPPLKPDTPQVIVTGDTIVRLQVTGTPEYLLPDEQARLRAQMLRGRNRIDPADPLRWTSSNPGVVSVNERSGEITAVAPGDARVRASSGGVTKEITVRVLALAITTLSLEGPVRLTIGDSRAVHAEARDQRGRPIAAAALRWRVSDPALGVVDGAGNVRALAAGSLRVTAAGGTAIAEHLIQVESPPVAPPVVTPPRPTPPTGTDSSVAKPVTPPPPPPGPFFTDADAATMVAFVANLLQSKNAGALRDLSTAQGTAEQASSDALLALIAQSTGIVVRNARPRPGSVSTAEGTVRASLELEWRDNFGRRRAPLELLLSMTKEGNATKLRGFRITNSPKL